MPDLIILDEKMAEGFRSAAGGFNTSIVPGGGGYEYRNQNWAAPRRRFEFAFNNKDQDEVRAVMAFVDDRRGALHPWLLKDWGNYQLTDELILTAAGGESTAQIKQTWGTNNAISIDRKHIKSGTLTVKRNDVAMTATTHYTVSSSGLITFVSPASLTGGDTIHVTAEFYHKVRFEADLYQPSIDGPSGRYGTYGAIAAIEVR
jgi:uncharacterized protein (TIGR02217 family)